jgi:1,4-dihydroxy-6-naphthoate synthase
VSPPNLLIGISPCPNDTFVFHALLCGAVRPRGFDVEIHMHDVQTLNEMMLAGELDASKVSFAAALRATRDTVVLRSGAALGFGVGPLLLKRRDAPPLRTARVLCPGETTTATLLYTLFHGGEGRVEQTVFTDILPALQDGRADYGVCIHEGRFTYERHGLERVEDLGTTWEQRTHSPLPLGGIVARTRLGPTTLRELDDAVRASYDFARKHPRDALATAHEHALELDEDVMRAHIDLYVNAWTRDLGPEGERALVELSRRARESGRLVADAPPIRVHSSRD